MCEEVRDGGGKIFPTHIENRKKKDDCNRKRREKEGCLPKIGKNKITRYTIYRRR